MTIPGDILLELLTLTSAEPRWLLGGEGAVSVECRGWNSSRPTPTALTDAGIVEPGCRKPITVWASIGKNTPGGLIDIFALDVVTSCLWVFR